MKKKFILATILLIISFSIFVFHSGNKNGQNQKNKIKKVEVSHNLKIDGAKTSKLEEKYKILMKNCRWEYRFYSPDKKNYIGETFYPNKPDIEFGYIGTKLYLNNRDSYFDENNYHEYFKKEARTSAIWISNSKVLIKGEYILDITNNTKEFIDFSNVLAENSNDATKNQWVSNYRLNQTKDKIAYVIAECTNENIARIYIYDIQNKHWEFIFKEKFDWEISTPYGISFLQLFWDYQNNLYFDITDFKVNGKIYKYNNLNNTVTLYKKGHMLESSSPNNEYFVLRNINHEKGTYIYFLVDMKKNSNLYVSTKAPVWADDNGAMFAIVDSKSSINIFSCKKGNIIKKINIEDIYSQGFNIRFLDYYNENFVFYAQKDWRDELGNLYIIP